MSDQPSKILPNSYQTPNFFVDELMRLLTGNEQKCVDIVCRKTFGWQKRSDRISKSQLVALSGMSDDAVDASMAALVQYGVVVRVSETVNNMGVEWAPQTDDALIDMSGLMARYSAKRAVNATRTVNARAKKAQGGDVGQAPLVGQPQGGDVGQPPQKPLSKANLIIVSAGDVFSAYEANVGIMTPVIADAINVWLDVELVPAVWIVEAIAVATKNNARNWAYIEAILKNWKANGKDAKKLSGGTNGKSKSGNGGQGGAAPVQPKPTDADRAAAERVKARRNGSLS